MEGTSKPSSACSNRPSMSLGNYPSMSAMFCSPDWIAYASSATTSAVASVTTWIPCSPGTQQPDPIPRRNTSGLNRPPSPLYAPLPKTHDALATGRGLRILTVVDSFTRECPTIEVNTGLSGERVTRVLEQVIAERGKPQAWGCDNAPEFPTRHFIGWCEEQRIGLVHIQPGRPMQNGQVESFNGRLGA